MLLTKFQGHRSSGSGEEDFLIYIYGHGGHVGHVTQLICINFHSYSPSSFHMNFGSKLCYPLEIKSLLLLLLLLNRQIVFEKNKF